MIRKLLVALAAFGLPVAAPAFADIPNAEQAPVASLGGAILREIAVTPADEDAVLAAITRASRGADLRVIVETLQQLREGQGLEAMVGADGVAQARATLARPEVQAALAESLEVAQLALQTYGSTGGVPAGGAPGQAFGSGGVGAPGGGGGSGYTN